PAGASRHQSGGWRLFESQRSCKVFARVTVIRKRRMTGLLDGVTVIEAAVLLTGDYFGMLLADEGADVVKIESPGLGDYIRDHMGAIAPHNSPYHLFVTRNTKSVT